MPNQEYIEAIRAEVNRLQTVRQSNRELLMNLASQIEALKDDPAELQALAFQLRSNVDELTNDVIAHTPSENESEGPEEP